MEALSPSVPGFNRDAASCLFVATVSQDTDENGMRGGEMEVPLNQLAKGEVPSGLSISDPTLLLRLEHLSHE